MKPKIDQDASGISAPPNSEAGAALAQLDRILKSPGFHASERNRAFLSHVVNETLAGRGERIKAYSIALSVFGRDQNFDAQNDPIIRQEAARLRTSLERYYLTEGKNDPIVIEIPKGSYVPRFIATQTPADPAPTVPRWTDRWTWKAWTTMAAGLAAVALGVWLGSHLLADSASREAGGPVATAGRGPSILVTPFQLDLAPQGDASLARGITREIIAALTRYSDLFVYAADTSLRFPTVDDFNRSYGGAPIDYVLSGGVSQTAEVFKVTATLTDGKTGRVIWSHTVGGDPAPASLLEIREEISQRLTGAVAQTYGVIFDEKAREIEGQPPRLLRSYKCVLSFYHYWRRFDRKLHGEVQECLERTIEEDPRYAEAFAALALVYGDSQRFGFGKASLPAEPLTRGLELARKAVELAPRSVLGYKALHTIHWLRHELDSSWAAAKAGLELNPRDSELLADYGARLCTRGDWAAGMPLLEKALARNPGQSQFPRVMTSLYYYSQRRFEDALSEAKKIDMPDIVYTHMLLAMASAKLGRKSDAAQAVERIVAIDPGYPDRMIADLNERNLHPSLIRIVADGMRDAGLAVAVTGGDKEFGPSEPVEYRN